MLKLLMGSQTSALSSSLGNILALLQLSPHYGGIGRANVCSGNGAEHLGHRRYHAAVLRETHQADCHFMGRLCDLARIGMVMSNAAQSLTTRVDYSAAVNYWHCDLHDRRWVALSLEIVYFSLKKFYRNGDWQPWTTYRVRGRQQPGLSSPGSLPAGYSLSALACTDCELKWDRLFLLRSSPQP